MPVGGQGPSGERTLRAMGSIEVIDADITTLRVDAIVNAANQRLRGGGGVDGAIHRAGGPRILEDCRRVVPDGARLPTGEAIATTAGDLPARLVVHTVGPVYADAGEDAPALLRSCYERSLAVAGDEGCRSIAFPSISTGVYGYPVEEASRIAMAVLTAHVDAAREPSRVVMCCHGEHDRAVYQRALEDLRGG